MATNFPSLAQMPEHRHHIEVLTRFLRRGLRVCALLSLFVASASGVAQEASPTLTKIRQSGIIVLGFREASVPFSYMNDRRRPVGYTVDICRHIARAVSERLQMPDLQVKMLLVSASSRIPMVAGGVVDMECGSTTNGVERQAQVSFSLTTYLAAIRILSKTQKPLRRLEDAKGDVVVSSAGTTSLKLLSELAATGSLRVSLLVGRDHADSFRMLQQGRASAFVMDDVLLRGLIAGSERPGDYAVSSEPLSVEPYAIALRKNDAQFKKLVDDTILSLIRSGEINRIHDRWFMSPIPPKGTALNMPMSPALKAAFATPSDSADPAAYR